MWLGGSLSIHVYSWNSTRNPKASAGRSFGVRWVMSRTPSAKWPKGKFCESPTEWSFSQLSCSCGDYNEIMNRSFQSLGLGMTRASIRKEISNNG